MRSRRRAIEFLIVGGGPAGSAAAITLAAAGREVVVVERTDYSAPRVGETLPPAANPILRSLGITELQMHGPHLRSPGTTCCWGRPEPYQNDFLFDPDGDGWHLDRATFDATLAKRATAVGAEVLTECVVCSFHRRDYGYEVEILRRGQHDSLHVSTLVDAAGRNRWPGRRTRHLSFDRQVALVRTMQLSEGANSIDRRTWIESTSVGWWYSARLPADRLLAAYFTDADLLHAHAGRLPAVWDALIADAPYVRERLRSAGGELIDLRVLAASSAITRPIVEDRYLAIGDAASTIDPLSSHGILYSLETGIEAAEALIHASPAEAQRRYALGIEERFHQDLLTRRQFCALERRWPDSPFWKRRAEEPAPMASSLNRRQPKLKASTRVAARGRESTAGRARSAAMPRDS